MSKSGKERSNFRGGGGGDGPGGGGGGGGGGGSGDGDDGDEDDEGVKSRDDSKKRRDYVCGKNFRRARHVVSFPFRKAKKHLVYSGRHKSRSTSSASCSGKTTNREDFVGCYLCFKPPQTTESPANSQTSDPNNPAFTYDHLKLLIEKNDFYSKECNPHIALPSFSD